MIDQNVSELTIVMWFILFLSIASAYNINYNVIHKEIDSNYETNKINKGIWRRHKHENPVPMYSGTFFFPPMSNEEPFTPNLQDLSFLTRYKRESAGTIRKLLAKNVKSQAKTGDDKRSIFNDLPIDIAMILDNTNDVNVGYPAHPRPETTESTKPIDKINSKDNSIIDDEILKDVFKSSEVNATTKRSMKYDELIVDKLNFLGFYNKSKTNKIQKSNEDKTWRQLPIDKDVFKIPPKNPKIEVEHRKPVTESGLIKVLSMLTKTFKKIVKQHNSIKTIHSKMSNMSKNLEEKTNLTNKKFSDFEAKYINIIKVVDKLKNFQECLKNKEEMYKSKEGAIAQNLIDFENQQKKFLAQQQQFYNIQKMMLAQNEKINIKQNSIAKMQTEISHKQNYFATILKQARLNMLNRFPKFKIGMLKYKPNLETVNETEETTTIRSTSVEPVTINLFSIAKNNVIENHDKKLLNEKDDKSVDDLIYKYYFNNTFLDTVIRNQILGGVLITDKTNIARNDKFAAKRDEDQSKNQNKLEYTVMLPVVSEPILKRERRWINHHSRRKHGKTVDGKGRVTGNVKNVKSTTSIPDTTKMVKESDVIAKDPFVVMATSFCKGIGQSTTQQILNWCVEKSIRRLRNLDMKMMPNVTPQMQLKTDDKDNMKSTLRPVPDSTNPPTTSKGLVPVTPAIPTSASKPSDSKQDAANKFSAYLQFFPGNEELEANLKQFDLTPDTAGNVYYDGSLHASALLGDKDSVSDILPGFDSNSKIDLDTAALKLQMSRKYVKNKILQKTKKN